MNTGINVGDRGLPNPRSSPGTTVAGVLVRRYVDDCLRVAVVCSPDGNDATLSCVRTSDANREVICFGTTVDPIDDLRMEERGATACGDNDATRFRRRMTYSACEVDAP